MKSIARVYAVFRRIFGRVTFVLAVIGATAIILIMLSTMTSSFCRWILVSIQGIDELNSLLVGMAIYLGIALTQASKRHITVSFLVKKLSTRKASILAILILAIVAALFGRISYLYYEEVYRALITRDFVHGIIRFPLWPLASVMFLGVTLLTIQLVIDVIERVRDVVTATPRKAPGKEVSETGGVV